jgi:hypothetical protein
MADLLLLYSVYDEDDEDASSGKGLSNSSKNVHELLVKS